MTREELRPWKADKGDKLIEKSCDTCAFDFGTVCAGNTDYYGVPMETVAELFPNGCDNWEISMDSFIEQKKLNGR